jgi:hypothetical protein
LEYAKAIRLKSFVPLWTGGKSGQRIEGRQDLKDLLKAVESRAGDFLVLVYGVSRWGRFHDADDSAYYECALKKAG